jgi:hypothetical protein
MCPQILKDKLKSFSSHVDFSAAMIANVCCVFLFEFEKFMLLAHFIE